MLLFRGGLNFDTATQDQVQQAMMKWKDWMDELAIQGRLIGGKRLTKKGVVLEGSKKQMTDGPYVEGKEMVGGYLGIKAMDFEEAIEIAHNCPIFNFDGIVEVREIIVN